MKKATDRKHQDRLRTNLNPPPDNSWIRRVGGLCCDDDNSIDTVQAVHESNIFLNEKNLFYKLV